MAKSRRFGKYSRRIVLGEKRSRAIVIAVAAVTFVLLCVIVSVAVGSLLGEKAEKLDERPAFDFSDKEYYSGDKLVESVDAYVYRLGTDAKGYIASGITDLSVCLRTSDGRLTYSSAVASVMGDQSYEELAPLSEHVDYIHGCGGRVCAYFYVKSFYEADVYLRELYADYEIALINEAAKCGVDDIMLVGLGVANSNIDEIEDYVSRAAFAAENAVLGVLVNESVIQNDDYVAARVRSVCDYIALDLRGFVADEAERESEEEQSEVYELLSRNEYYIEAVGMRLVLSKDNSHLYDSFKDFGIKNIQITGE